MGTPWPENQCAHRKRKIEKLIKVQARDTAIQLQNRSEKPIEDHDGLEKLLEERFISFTESLSHVSLCRCKDCECEVTQIPNRVGSPISDQISVDSGKGKRPVAEDRRGSYERKFRGSNERSSVPSKTISDSGSHSRRISSETISTQNTTSTPSSAAPVRRREERKKEAEKKKEEPAPLVLPPPPPYQIVPPRPYQIGIGSLKRLTHLDMSKLYYLDHMPKEISNLLGLKVLKGFVVGNSMEKEKDSCTLEHLAKLKKLRKLSIYTKREDFPVISDLRDLKRLKRLHKLKIEWGGVSVHKSENITKVDNSSEEMAAVESTKQENHGHADTEIVVYEEESGAKFNSLSTFVLSDLFVALSLLPVENDASPELPPQLEELHLKCLPWTSAPNWLRASKRNKIKKLHIEGGPLSDLGQLALQERSEWQVEILRLKFLKDLEMNWTETDLRKLFPKLIYFEKVSCPKLKFTPMGQSVHEKATYNFRSMKH